MRVATSVAASAAAASPRGVSGIWLLVFNSCEHCGSCFVAAHLTYDATWLCCRLPTCVYGQASRHATRRILFIPPPAPSGTSGQILDIFFVFSDFNFLVDFSRKNNEKITKIAEKSTKNRKIEKISFETCRSSFVHDCM